MNITMSLRHSLRKIYRRLRFGEEECRFIEECGDSENPCCFYKDDRKYCEKYRRNEIISAIERLKKSGAKEIDVIDVENNMSVKIDREEIIRTLDDILGEM